MPRPFDHGTTNGYFNHKCHCPECRAAATAYNRELRRVRALRLKRDPTIVPHGRASTYYNWACRCSECKAVHAERQRRDRERSVRK